jgi:hypothetical protein
MGYAFGFDGFGEEGEIFVRGVGHDVLFEDGFVDLRVAAAHATSHSISPIKNISLKFTFAMPSFQRL